MQRLLTIKELIKFNAVFKIKFVKIKDNEEVFTSQHFNPGTQIVLHERDLEDKIDFSMNEIGRRVEEFLQMGSGWVYDETEEVSLNVFKYKPQR